MDLHHKSSIHVQTAGPQLARRVGETFLAESLCWIRARVNANLVAQLNRTYGAQPFVSGFPKKIWKHLETLENPNFDFSLLFLKQLAENPRGV